MITTITLHEVLPDVFRGRTLCSEIWEHEVTFLQGKSYLIEAASGTGKSSLCSYIYGNRTDYQGNISIDDRIVRSLSPEELTRLWQQELAILFQELRLFPSLTAMENVWLKNQQTHYRTQAWIEQMFEHLGLADQQHQLVNTLSWGQQQRVAFIRLLCQPASFMLLDEPISHLDEPNARLMADILAAEQQQTGVGVIVTSVGKHLPMQYDALYRL